MRFEPTGGQVGTSLGLVIAGLVVTLGIARFGNDE
jgi:hypothetical protein